MTRPLTPRSRVPWRSARAALLVSLGAAAAGCPAPEEGEGPFSLDLRLVGPVDPDPFAGADVIEVDFAYADGSEWSVYWEGPAGGSQDFDGVPRGEGVVLTVLALRADGLYEGNVAPVASGRSSPVDLLGDSETSVLVATRGVFSVAPSALAAPRRDAALLAFEDGTVVVAGGLGALTASPAVSSVEVTRVAGPGDLLDVVPFGDLPRVHAAAASDGSTGVLWGGLTEVAADLFDGATAAHASPGVVVVRPEVEGGEPTVEPLADGDLGPRYAGAAVALGGGRFAAFGGLRPAEAAGAPEGVTTIDVFDAAAGDGAPTGDALAWSRAFPTATDLGDGRVLVAGGFVPGDAGAPRPVVPALELWGEADGVVPLGDLVHGRALHDAVLVDAGRLLVVGGVGADGLPVAEAELYSFDPGNPAAGLLLDSTWSVLWPRAGARAVALPGGGALLCGGEDAAGPVAPCERFSLAGDSLGFAPVVREAADGSEPTLDGLPDAAAGAAAVALPSGMVLIAGGWDGEPSGEIRIFNP